MKISKSIQRRTVILVVLAALFAIYPIAHFTTKLIYSTDGSIAGENLTYIGTLNMPYKAYDNPEVYDEFALTVERDAYAEPLVEALPTSMMFFSKSSDFEFPDHFGWHAHKIVNYVVLALLVVMELLICWILVSAMRGFRTGSIFRSNHPCLLRWLALVTFFYYILLENRSFFAEYAIGDIYGDMLSVELVSSVTLSVEVFITPLLLLIFAEFITIAARINEEESMTI